MPWLRARLTFDHKLAAVVGELAGLLLAHLVLQARCPMAARSVTPMRPKLPALQYRSCSVLASLAKRPTHAESSPITRCAAWFLPTWVAQGKAQSISESIS